MATNRFAVRKANDRKNRYFDINLLLAVIFLLIFGLVMVYSSSSYDAYLTFGNASYYLRKQVFATIAGIAVMILVAFWPYQHLEKIAWFAYIASIVIIFLIIPFGHEANGAKRWIYIGGVSVQPAEIAKAAMIVFLACIISRMGRAVSTWRGFAMVLAMVAPISILLWAVTSNASSAIIVMGIAVVMLFVSTPDYKRYIFGAVGVAVMAALVVVIIVTNASRTGGSAGGYRGDRILAWIDPEAYASGKAFQTLQARYAIGSGGFFGKGLGESMQKLGFIPEAQNDMIFSVICEELGLFGALALLFMFIFLLWRLKIIADHANDLFGALLVVGVMGHISIQVILNIAVVTGTIPNTGISLPFISYGGSAVFFLLAEIGLALSVARGIRLRDY